MDPPPPPPFQPLKDKGRGAAIVIFRPEGGDLAAEVKGGGFCEVSKELELMGIGMERNVCMVHF
jgi:hypothetical protein